MKTADTPTITICSSANFYKHVVELQAELGTLGYKVIVPENAARMAAANDFDVSHYKTWFGNENDYPEKARLMHAHFDEVARGDAVLIVNDEKHGIANYIGGNVLMEMAIAFHLKKPIFILNDLPAESAYMEELKGMLPTLLHGDIKTLASTFPVIA